MKHPLTTLQSSRRHTAGFTVVELLVVITIIAILAAITVVAYNGVQKRAIETTLKSDLRNAASQLELHHTKKGTYPAQIMSGPTAIQASENNTFAYSPKTKDFCLAATTERAGGLSYFMKGSSGKITEGTCPPSIATVTTIAGSSEYGYNAGTVSGSEARFNLYNSVDRNEGGAGIDVDAQGNVYIADRGNNVIRKMTPAGDVSVFAGMKGDAGNIESTNALTASFNYPLDLTIYNDNGEEKMLVIEKCISEINIEQAPNYPMIIINSNVLEYHDEHYECPYSTSDETQDAWNGRYLDGDSIVVDSERNAYINELGSSKVRKMAYNTTSDWWGDVTNLIPDVELAEYSRFGIDPQDRVYSAAGNKIVRFNPQGVRTDFAGAMTTGNTDGKTDVARFNDPRGIDVDGNGNIYIAECGNRSIRKITTTGDVTTIAGGGAAGNVDGQGTAARFYCPIDLAIGPDGVTLYVIDAVHTGNENVGIYIRKLNI